MCVLCAVMCLIIEITETSEHKHSDRYMFINYKSFLPFSFLSENELPSYDLVEERVSNIQLHKSGHHIS